MDRQISDEISGFVGGLLRRRRWSGWVQSQYCKIVSLIFQFIQCFFEDIVWLFGPNLLYTDITCGKEEKKRKKNKVQVIMCRGNKTLMNPNAKPEWFIDELLDSTLFTRCNREKWHRPTPLKREVEEASKLELIRIRINLLPINHYFFNLDNFKIHGFLLPEFPIQPSSPQPVHISEITKFEKTLQ